MDWIGTAADVAEAVAVVVAATAAWRSLSAWRREMTARRRAELAELTLAMFYQARDLIKAARFPGAFGGEGSSRQRAPDEGENEQNSKDAYYTPVERLSRQSEFWGKLEAARYPFMATFGADAAEPFEAIRQAKNRVMISARMLIQTFGQNGGSRSRERNQDRWEADIGWTSSDEDELGLEVDRAVLAIEAICRPEIIGRVPRGAGRRCSRSH